MKLYLGSFWLLAFVVIGLTSCASSEERLNSMFEALPQIDSTLLFEYSDTYSSATGECVGVFLDRWYGTSTTSEDVTALYFASLPKDGWNIWPEDVVEIWSLQNSDGLFRMTVDVYNDPGSISQQQANYQLPNSFYPEASHYRTVYLVSMTYRSPAAAERCFGR